jgi:hypothetical protein
MLALTELSSDKFNGFVFICISTIIYAVAAASGGHAPKPKLCQISSLSLISLLATVFYSFIYVIQTCQRNLP